MSIRNKVQLMGNLGNNPEITSFESGSKNAKFSLATNETYTNSKDEKVTDTQWHNIVVWGKLATIVEKYLKKGSEVTVEGKLTTRSYETKQTNEKRYITEVVVNELVMMGAKQGSDEPETEGQ